MNAIPNRDLSNEVLVERLRKLASIWFNNSDSLLLEELIRRFSKPKETTNG